MDSEEAVLQKALLLLDRGQPKSAEPLLRALIRSAEPSADRALLLKRSLVALGECLAVTGRPVEARQRLQQALAIEVAEVSVKLDRERAHEILEELEE
jgi:hypothetical protein